MHREDGGLVEIHFVLHGDWLEITIEDNGVGRARSASYKSNNGETHHSIGIEVATKEAGSVKKERTIRLRAFLLLTWRTMQGKGQEQKS